MAETNITILDGSGASRTLRFWDDGSGNLIPIHQAQALGGKALPENDQSGTGNGSAVFATATKYVDFWNGGTVVATLVAGGITRRIPPGASALCEFGAAATTFTVTTDGDWIARGLQ